MSPNFLWQDQPVRANGSGPMIDLGETRPSLLNLTLGITRVIEQESLDVTIHGSSDGETWQDKPLTAFPQKFYCGVYSLMLDLSENPDVRFLRVNWKLNRWGRGESEPLFNFYVFAEPVASHLAAAQVA